MTMTCDQLDTLLPEFFDGALSAEQETAAANHMATCSDCRTVVSELEGVSSLFRTQGRMKLPDDARERIKGALGLEGG